MGSLNPNYKPLLAKKLKNVCNLKRNLYEEKYAITVKNLE